MRGASLIENRRWPKKTVLENLSRGAKFRSDSNSDSDAKLGAQISLNRL